MLQKSLKVRQQAGCKFIIDQRDLRVLFEKAKLFEEMDDFELFMMQNDG